MSLAECRRHLREIELPQHGAGIWAPAIRKQNGKFWIFFPMPDEGIYTVTADHPTGTWSEPHLVQEGKGLVGQGAPGAVEAKLLPPLRRRVAARS